MQPLLQWNSNITQPECVFVALGIQHAMHMGHIVNCALLHSKIFFHIISYTARFKKNNNLLNVKGVFQFSLQLLSETSFILSRNECEMIKNVQ
jgi:hypothetical protein